MIGGEFGHGIRCLHQNSMGIIAQEKIYGKIIGWGETGLPGTLTGPRQEHTCGPASHRPHIYLSDIKLTLKWNMFYHLTLITLTWVLERLRGKPGNWKGPVWMQTLCLLGVMQRGWPRPSNLLPIPGSVLYSRGFLLVWDAPAHTSRVHTLHPALATLWV